MCSVDVYLHIAVGVRYMETVLRAICNCIGNFHLYNAVCFVKLFMCYRIITVLLPFWAVYGEYFIDVSFCV